MTQASRYAVRCHNGFMNVWFSEADPKYTWTLWKRSARWYETVQEAEAKALFLVSKYPEHLGHIYIHEEATGSERLVELGKNKEIILDAENVRVLGDTNKSSAPRRGGRPSNRKKG